MGSIDIARNASNVEPEVARPKTTRQCETEQTEEERDENCGLLNEPKVKRNANEDEVEKDANLSHVVANGEKTKNSTLPQVEPEIEGIEVVSSLEDLEDDEFYECYSSP